MSSGRNVSNKTTSIPFLIVGNLSCFILRIMGTTWKWGLHVTGRVGKTLTFCAWLNHEEVVASLLETLVERKQHT